MAALFLGAPAGRCYGLKRGNRFPLKVRNSYRSRKIVNRDLRVSRRLRLTESMNLEVLAEPFNLFNHSNVTGITNSLFTFNAASNTLTCNTTADRVQPFLTPTSINNTTIFTPRQVQLSVRFHF